MSGRKKVFAIVGSAAKASSNLRLVQYMAEASKEFFDLTVYDALGTLPHFSPELSVNGTPAVVEKFRNEIAAADAVAICTPEYIFSLPSGLKNAFEWCVATTVFSDKPMALLTASAHGAKGHEELQLIARTLGAVFTNETLLLVQGVKGKVDKEGNSKEAGLQNSLLKIARALLRLIESKSGLPVV